jgi:hypothetical protein
MLLRFGQDFIYVLSEDTIEVSDAIEADDYHIDKLPPKKCKNKIDTRTRTQDIGCRCVGRYCNPLDGVAIPLLHQFLFENQVYNMIYKAT